MKKFSRLSQVSLLLAVLFTVDKLLGVARQMLISRQFGLSAELDVFNAANNLPDMLFMLISGGALTIAFIPVLTEVLNKDGKKAAWELFSNVLNLVFLVTAAVAIIFGIFAQPLVSSQLGVAPGFSAEQIQLTVILLRLNLVATLVFSVSGLVMAGLQANQHFLSSRQDRLASFRLGRGRTRLWRYYRCLAAFAHPSARVAQVSIPLAAQP